MNYTPLAFSRINLQERASEEIATLTAAALVRELQIDGFSIDGGWLYLYIIDSDIPLAIRQDHRMTFGTEVVTAIEYLKRVLERGDLIDVVARPARNGVVEIELFWIHIAYVGEIRSAGGFSKKEDGLFAMRAKAGEKAERIVARVLRDDCGHLFDTRVFETPGYFEIRYDSTKRQRRPDLKCLNCGITIEVKKRNRDKRFRVSHSDVRPFSSENDLLGWHAFVFPDMKARFLSNAAIADAINNSRFEPGLDQYDAWADVHGEDICEMSPPKCQCENKI